MSEELSLIVQDRSLQTFDYNAAAVQLKENALSVGALIGRVTNADEQKAAVAAQVEVVRILKLAEQARKAAKDPVLEYGRRIDDSARRFVTELKNEEIRLARMVGDFQQLEQARIAAAQRAENERLANLERERAAELAKAQSHDELDAVNTKFDNRAQQEAPPVQVAARAEGQTVRNDWNIEVSDIWLLAKAHPTCVRIEPLVGEIKNLLKAGVKVSGVRATPIVKAQVRTGKEPLAINI